MTDALELCIIEIPKVREIIKKKNRDNKKLIEEGKDVKYISQLTGIEEKEIKELTVKN